MNRTLLAYLPQHVSEVTGVALGLTPVVLGLLGMGTTWRKRAAVSLVGVAVAGFSLVDNAEGPYAPAGDHGWGGTGWVIETVAMVTWFILIVAIAVVMRARRRRRGGRRCGFKWFPAAPCDGRIGGHKGSEGLGHRSRSLA